jgi:hypothetical protein
VSTYEQEIIRLGKALSDKGFRKDFASDPDGTLSKHGYNIPDDVRAALKKHSKNLDTLSDVKESLQSKGLSDGATAQLV